MKKILLRLYFIFRALVVCMLLSTTILSSQASQAAESGIALIVHPSNPLKNISKDEIMHLFLNKTDTVQNIKLTPVIQTTFQSIRVVFDEDALGKTPSRSKAYWSRIIFTSASTPPQQMENSNEVIKWIAAHPDSIGYVELEAVNNTVKLLKKL